jgi:hypothetical protein
MFESELDGKDATSLDENLFFGSWSKIQIVKISTFHIFYVHKSGIANPSIVIEA